MSNGTATTSSFADNNGTANCAKQATVKFKPVPIDLLSTGENRISGRDDGVKTPTSPATIFSGSAQTPVTPREDAELAYEKKKIGHRRFDKQTGTITYKKFPTSEIMGAIQLGITNSVGSLASKPYRDLLMQDFAVVDDVPFPREGSHITPSHPYSDFRFIAYASTAFRYFRELFQIKPEDFLASISDPLRELSNPGASGSIFYISDDDQFIIKTVQHKEANFLQKLLPGYYMNLNQNPRTLLPKFFGLYCYKCLNKNVRLLVMNNLLPSSIHIHHKFDLKGSTYKRRASKYEKAKDSPTLKDLDYLEDYSDGISLELSTYEAVIKTIAKDCRVLESFKIMDYSLLVGIHNIDMALREHEAENDQSAPSVSDTEVRLQFDGDGRIVKPDPVQRKVVRQKTVFSTWDSIQPDAAPVDLDDEYPTGGIPARNSRGDRLLLFLGIIDILQSYQLFKKFEHAMKSVIHDGDTISVHRPNFYAQRFQDFMKTNVFKKTKSPFKHSPSKKKQRRGTAGSIEERYKTGSPSEAPVSGLVASARADSLAGISPAPAGSMVASRRSIFETPRSSTLSRWDTVDNSATTREPKKVERLFACSEKRDSVPTVITIDDQMTTKIDGGHSSTSPKLRPPLETNL